MSNNSSAPIFPVLWFTGLSASGKSTLSESLAKSLKNRNYSNVVLLDGEAIRDQLNNFNFENNSREEIGFQKAKAALNLNNQGNIVIVTGIAHKKKWRQDVRQMFDSFFEIYLRCDVKICAKRDFKDNYRRAELGEINNFIGVHEPYEEYENFDLLVDTDKNSIDYCSSVILAAVIELLNKNINKNN